MTDPSANRIPLRWLIAVLLSAALVALCALWSPVFLAAWCAHLARALQDRLVLITKRPGRAAALITGAFAVVVLVPLSLLTMVLIGSASDLLDQLRNSQGWSDAIDEFLKSKGETSPGRPDPTEIIALLQRHGQSAASAASTVSSIATRTVLFMLVFVTCFYSFLVHSARIYDWILASLPLHPDHTARLSRAFFETGRGLLVSFGLTAMVQAPVLAIGYAIIGVPHPLVLGLLTLIASFIPLLGTGMVWVPVTLGLLFVGRNETALWSLGLGTTVSSIDNVMRPALSRFGKLQLPALLVFLAMLGGVATFGPGGLLLGPLFVRLAMEVLHIRRDELALPQTSG